MKQSFDSEDDFCTDCPKQCQSSPTLVFLTWTFRFQIKEVITVIFHVHPKCVFCLEMLPWWEKSRKKLKTKRRLLKLAKNNSLWDKNNNFSWICFISTEILYPNRTIKCSLLATISIERVRHKMQISSLFLLIF